MSTARTYEVTIGLFVEYLRDPRYEWITTCLERFGDVPQEVRHSYITHLTEFGYPARFVQEQVGHSHAATTAIYMGVSNEYRNRMLEASLKSRLGEDWE
ncbi:tyrosine-type recombinase/integrase [Streptomyces platensis]|uniref:tyrosine-type recombinase/integrase n=1 Tax=Streptomyces platensis TaxID=58346 RepID=UPI003C2FE9AA